MDKNIHYNAYGVIKIDTLTQNGYKIPIYFRFVQKESNINEWFNPKFIYSQLERK